MATFNRARNHKTGYTVYLYGESYWHRSLYGAQRRVRGAAYCSDAQIIDCTTGEQV